MIKDLTIPDEVVVSKIYLIRNQKVMIDIDLAELYQVENKRLNEKVKRNADRFPADFMFQLTKEEWDALRSQVATSKSNQNLKSQFATSSWGGRRKIPNVFTEHGVLMLSSVLNSDRAIQVNIRIMRIYSKLREMVITSKDILLKLETLEKTVTQHDQNIKVVFDYLRELLNPKTPPMRKIGFKQKLGR